MGKRGFTLIELLVALSIVSIISIVGFVSYSQSQTYARDVKRKNDLRAIATALELYYQANKRYPCPGTDVWNWSTAGGVWIQDNGCGGAVVNMGNNYINQLPTDPINNHTGSNPPGSGYGYGYRGNSSSCPSKLGQYFILYTLLENTKDPQSIQSDGSNKPTECNGTLIDWPAGTYSITSP